MERRIVIVDDDKFVLQLLAATLTAIDFDVTALNGAAEFASTLETFDPHVVMVDLDLGTGPSGLDLLEYVKRQAPWIGRVLLSTHRSPRLVDSSDIDLSDVAYVVKGDVSSPEQLLSAIEASLRGERFTLNESDQVVHLTTSQADVLRLVAAGYSNDRIAQERNIATRSVEQTLRRTFRALGVGEAPGENPRVLAARMLTRAQVVVDE